MKKKYSILAAFATVGLSLVISSCNKTISGDDPLPVDFKPSLYIGSDNRILYSYNLETFDKNWEFTAKAAIKATPVVFKSFVILIDQSGEMYKLDRINGKVIQKRTIGAQVLASPTVNDTAIFVATMDGRMIAYNGANIEGDPYWTRSGLNPMISSPIIKKLTAIEDETWGLIGANTLGEVFALNVKDGAQIWKNNAGAGATAFVSSPTASNTNILIGNTNGKLYHILAHNGAAIWNFTTAGPITSSPISFGGNVMFGSADRYFYSVDSTTGTLRWKIMTDDKVESSPFFDNQFVYFGSNDMNVYCVDIIHGLLKWKKRTFSVVKSSPVVNEGKVFAGSYDKNLYILGVDSGVTMKLLDIKGQIETSPVLDYGTAKFYPSVTGNHWRK